MFDSSGPAYVGNWGKRIVIGLGAAPASPFSVFPKWTQFGYEKHTCDCRDPD